MHKNKLLDQLRLLVEYAQKDRQVAVKRAEELILNYTLSVHSDIKNALRHIKQN